MNKKIYILLFCIAALCSCHQAELTYKDISAFKPTDIQESDIILNDGTLNPDIRYMTDYTEDRLSSPRRIASITATDMLCNLAGSLNYNKIIQIAGTYTGKDIDGSPLTLSGKIILPKNGKIKNIVVISHYTIGANDETPSETFPIEGTLAGKGYAIVMPDYIGYGATRTHIHPYLHAESTAQSVVDMILAARQYLSDTDCSPKDERVILAGYSQGGATTVATMRLIESQYADKIKIKKVYAGAGPYNLTATYDIAMNMDITGIPCAIPMIIQGIDYGENLGLDYADFFQPKLLDNYDLWINSKDYTVGEINTRIGAKHLSDILTDKGRDKNNKETARLYIALKNNSVLNFLPQAPVYLFHSKTDDTVPFINSMLAEKAFKGRNIECDFGDYGSHATGFLTFFGVLNQEL